MFGYIYKTTNLVNNKIYIGKKENPNFDSSYLGSGKLIKRSIKKYGEKNFKVELICYCKNLTELNNLEKHYIKKFKSHYKFGKGYNIAEGGDGGNLIQGWSQERLNKHKKQKSIQNSGKNNPNYGNGDKIRGDKNPSKRPEVRIILSEKLSGENNPMFGVKGEDHPRYGKKHADETRNKIREALKNKIYTKVCKNCNQTFETKAARTTYCSKECKRQHRDNLEN